MKLAVLGSGSGGNAVIVESGGRSLLIDAGFSCRRIEERLGELGREAGALDALLLTHEHQDHVVGADRLVRRHGVPVFATEGTLAAAALSPEATDFFRPIRSGRPFLVESRDTSEPIFRVEAFRLPHDAREPVGFVVEDATGRRLGLVADLGARTQLAWGRLRDLDALIIETNHDLGMLRQGPYPWHLKQRVASRHGHLSNAEAAFGVDELVSDRLRWVVLYHLSRTNNQPALAAQAVGETLDRRGSKAQLVVTQQDAATPWVEIDRGQLALTF